MKATYSIKLLSTVFPVTHIAFLGSAQDSKEEKYSTNNDRHWFAEIPIWIPGFRGQLAYGAYEFSSSGSDEEKEHEALKSDLGIEFYFVGRIAARYNNFWINADAFFGRIGSAFSYTSLIGNKDKEIVDITVHGTIPRLVVGYSIWQHSNANDFKIELAPYAGITYVNIYSILMKMKIR